MPDRTTDPENWYRALSFDPDGPYARSLGPSFLHDDEANAIESAARLDAILTDEVGTKNVPYADRFASFDITVDGVLVSAVLDLNSEIGFWIESLMLEEPLYWADGRTMRSG